MPRRFRIGVDLHVADGIYQGSRTHVLELFSRAVALCPEFDFYFFVDGVSEAKKFSDKFEERNSFFVRMPHANPLTRLGWQIPSLQKKYGMDLLHTQYIIPLLSFCPSMVTIHDVLFESHPEYFTSAFKLRSKLLVRRSASKAAHVFTVSEFSKREIEKRYRISPATITVTPNGVDIIRFHPGPDGTGVLDALGLKPRSYILAVGRLEPRKNHLGLLESYAALGSSKPPLVVVGQKHFGFEEIFERASQLGITNDVRFLDQVNDADLPSLYRHSKMFVYPTWAEGFGMPVLEAMASGVPVITSNNTSLPEVIGDAGILVQAGDAGALTDAMRRVLSRDDLASKMAEAGLRRARSFSWDESARRLGDAYQRFFASALKQRETCTEAAVR